VITYRQHSIKFRFSWLAKHHVLTLRLATFSALLFLNGCLFRVPLPAYGIITVPGGRIVFQVIGEADEYPVLFIHGGPGGTSCSYPSSISDIKKDRQVVLYDQLGSGFSERIQDLKTYAKLPRYVDELKAITKDLGLRKFHIVAHSWGAAIALEYLLEEPSNRVQSVVFVGPLFSTQRWIDDTKILIQSLPEKTQTVIQRARNTGDYTSTAFRTAEQVYWSHFGARTPTTNLNNRQCNATPPGDSGLYNYMWGPAEFIANGTLKNYNRIDRLHEINIPTLFLIGQFDEVRQETILEYQSSVVGSKVSIIPESGHMIHLDQPEKFNHAITNFLEEVEAN